MGVVGIDLLEIDRMARALERRPRLRERLFTPGERAYADSQATPAAHYAARFCAKEAIVKALALTAWAPHEIEIVGGGDAAPQVRLHGRLAGLGPVSVSLTHSRGTAGAVALAPVPADGEGRAR